MTTTVTKTLFTPVMMGDLMLSNRIVMAPLTRNRAGEGNTAQEMMVDYYRQRASAGLIISEASQVSPMGVGYPNTPGIHSEQQIAAWKKVTDAVHQAGGHIFIQLWHVGRISHSSMLPDNQAPVAPSALQASGDAFTYEGLQPFDAPRALEGDEINSVIADFVTAAENAIKAGFDGVEIHAANGYLIDQFIRDKTNKRTDAYGGSIENRIRLLKEIVEQTVEVCGRHRVGVRISPENTFNDIDDSNPAETFYAVARMLSAYPLAYLHVVEGDMNRADGEGVARIDYHQLRRLFSGLYMANHRYDREKGEAAIGSGSADLVSYGALFISNPDLPERFYKQAELVAPDPATFYGGDEKGYTDYPRLQG